MELAFLIKSRRIPLYPFLAAQNPGYENVGQALRFCLSDLVKMKRVPARTWREFGLDLGEQTLNTKGAGLHGCWSSRAKRLSCREPLGSCGEPLGRRSRPCGPRVALASASQGTRALCPGHCRYGHRPKCSRRYALSRQNSLKPLPASLWLSGYRPQKQLTSMK